MALKTVAAVAALAVLLAADSSGVRGVNEPMTTGSVAFKGQFPWHVAVLKVGAAEGEDLEMADVLGAGAVISRNYVLTAASALSDTYTELTEVLILLGALNLRNVDKKGFRVASKQLIRHPQWNSQTAENDVALVKFVAPQLVGDSKVRLPASYQAEASYLGKTVSIVSWGLDDGQNEHSLVSVYNQEVLSNKRCQTAQEDTSVAVPFTKMCIYQPDDPTTPGEGDRGDAVVLLEKDNNYTLVGIVTSDSQGFDDKPSFLVRVGQYLDWIKDNSDVQ